MKKWELIHKGKAKNAKRKTEEIIAILLENRDVKTKQEKEEFLNPSLENVTIQSLALDKKQLQKTIDRIQKATQQKEHIVVFGDYDVDGICAAAILWETLRDLGADAVPYIPHRIDEGYGLSIKGIENLKKNAKKPKLIITVDNGIVAHEAVAFANKEGINVIITDHHVPAKQLPDAYAIVHTTRLCGAGVAWILAQALKNKNKKIKGRKDADDHLALAVLATIADLVPLKGANRTLTTYGLEILRQTKRVGLLELCKEAAIDPKTINVYQIGHIIAPRLNAMGRLEYAMESLRLLCTNDNNKARLLAEKLGSTNRERQTLTQETVAHATSYVRSLHSDGKKLLFVSHETYQQGVIGLVAGRLVEQFYKPAIVVAKGEQYSKASARSVSGFNIIEFIRSASDLLVDAGGHPMAAGFTVETAKLQILQETLETLAQNVVGDNMLVRSLRIDCELPLSLVIDKLYDAMQKLAPFGMGNPEPTFVSRNITIDDMRVVGYGGKHLKCKFHIPHSKFQIEGIGFGLGEKISELKIGRAVAVVYTIDKNTWNGNSTLQLKVKDITKTVY